MSRYIYEDKVVKSGRSTKWCDSCGKTIKPGESSITIVVYSDEFFNNTVCSQKCRDKYYEDFDKSEEEENEDE